MRRRAQISTGGSKDLGCPPAGFVWAGGGCTFG